MFFRIVTELLVVSQFAIFAIMTARAFTWAGRFSPLGPGWHQVVRPLTVKRDGSSHLAGC